MAPLSLAFRRSFNYTGEKHKAAFLSPKGMVRLGVNDEARFRSALKDVERDADVCLMKNYRQHKGNSTFRHCHNVAVYSFMLAQRLRWDIDEDALARGAMLHDFHLYTRQDEQINFLLHAFLHPKLALRNAEGTFELNDKEKNIITSHMWPLTPLNVPKSKEAFLVTLADKYCAFREMQGHHRQMHMPE